MEKGRKDHGNKDLRDDQGPSKCTRVGSKKSEAMDDKELDELRASIVKMNILADQAMDLLKTF